MCDPYRINTNGIVRLHVLPMWDPYGINTNGINANRYLPAGSNTGFLPGFFITSRQSNIYDPSGKRRPAFI